MDNYSLWENVFRIVITLLVIAGLCDLFIQAVTRIGRRMSERRSRLRDIPPGTVMVMLKDGTIVPYYDAPSYPPVGIFGNNGLMIGDFEIDGETVRGINIDLDRVK